MRRRDFVKLIAGSAAMWPFYAHAQTGSGAWGTARTKSPTVSVLSSAGGADASLVREAVAFWNDQFAAIGSPFRIGAVNQASGTISVAALQALSAKVLSRTGPAELPMPLSESMAALSWHYRTAISSPSQRAGRSSKKHLSACAVRGSIRSRSPTSLAT
jgi:hypothetical protein